MVILLLEKVPSSLRGTLSRWMIELKSGVFIGTMSALVRDKLWTKCVKELKGGGIILIWKTNNEQGFSMRSAGNTQSEIIDFDGIALTAKTLRKMA